MRLDDRGVFPSGMEEYLSQNGWHFSLRMAEWAVSIMKDRNNGRLDSWTRDMVDNLLNRYGITIDNNIGYDAVYVANMAKADYYGDALPDERSVAVFVKDYLDDKDGYEGKAFTRFYADCIGKGMPIPWEDVL